MNNYIRMTLFILASCAVFNTYASNTKVLPNGKYWFEFIGKSKPNEKPIIKKTAVILTNNKGTITVTSPNRSSSKPPIVGLLKSKHYSAKVKEGDTTLELVGKLVKTNLLEGDVTRTNKKGDKKYMGRFNIYFRATQK